MRPIIKKTLFLTFFRLLALTAFSIASMQAATFTATKTADSSNIGAFVALDTTKPTVSIIENQGPPYQAHLTFQDMESGIAEIVVTKSENADTVVPPFIVGTTEPIVISSTKIDQTQPINIELRVTDLAGNLLLFTFADSPTIVGNTVKGTSGNDFICLVQQTNSTVVEVWKSNQVCNINNKVVIGPGTETMIGTYDATDNKFNAQLGNGNDYLNAQGLDTVELTATGGIGNDTITGGGASDNLYGNEGSDILSGLGGNDYLNGGAGDNDNLRGGGGSDELEGGPGNDVISGRDALEQTDTEIDTVIYTNSAEGITVNLRSFPNDSNNLVGHARDKNQSSSDPIQGDAPNSAGERLYAIENVRGTAFDDMINGNANDNKLFGGGGNDIFTGGAGADSFKGEAGINDAATDFNSAEGDCALDNLEGNTGETFCAGVSDTDLDGVPDFEDNCPNTSNPGQEDSDMDTIGDACENQSPVAQCKNVTVTLAAGATTAAADINDGSYDPDGDTLSLMYNPAGPYGVGQTVVTLTVNDGKGGTDSCMGTVKVLYNFAGFFKPINNLPAVNVVKAGQAIPIKFSLSGDKGLNIFAAGYPVSTEVDCETGEVIGTAGETGTAGGSSLSYDPLTDQYSYVWKTNKTWGGTCRILTIKLNDGSEYTAKFRFR